ncbi:hypothetical protein ACH5RR_010192 [Cinchona calisaya]|uniref:Leucine-rich repeat-containing N-terminal plant-type domain-containing protein n=1 Tax=Cinchona calisaya TaxID=153742 RepID=A0ABD3AGA0_9GENT
MNSPASFRQSSFPLILLLFLNFLLSGFCLAASRPGNETDKLALLQFKSQITDDPLQVLAAYESLHFCQWPGITCAHKHQRLTSLNLPNQKLGGRISPHIGNLSFSTFSTWRTTPSKGEIPFNLSRCSKLANLTLDHNYLQGRVPSELGSLPELVVLSLQRNNLTGTLPASFGNLSSLQTLNLLYNSFEGEIPETISQLRSLVTFGVGANNFSGAFPPSLVTFALLEFKSRIIDDTLGVCPPGMIHFISASGWEFHAVVSTKGSLTST